MHTSRSAPSSPLAAPMLALALALMASVVPEPVAQAQPLPVDDCSGDLYQDRTAPGADRSLNWNYSFASDPERCIVVRVGQTVTWQGNFDDHPLEADQGDRPNPIDSHAQGVVRFDRPGVFGFRCNFHLAMRGAVQVLPALSPVPWSGPGLKISLIALLSVLSLLAAHGKLGRGVQRARFARRWLEPALLLASAACLAHALGPARYGSPDSATYLSAAEHLLNGDGYVISTLNERGEFAALSCFAPLFSILIALDMKLLGQGAQSAMADVVLSSFVLYAFACRSVLLALIPRTVRRWLPALTILLLTTSGSVTCLHGALSDLLGAALVLFACSLLLRVDQRGSALVAGATFAVAIWARWANLYFAASACLGVLLCRPSLPLWQRARRALVLASCVLIGVGPLWLRNILGTGTPMGPRAPFISSPILHVQRALTGVLSPVVEPVSTLAVSPMLSALYIVALPLCLSLVAALWTLRRDPRTDLGLMLALGYASLLVLSSSSTHFDSLVHPRFWLPVIPLLLALSVRAVATWTGARGSVPASLALTLRSGLTVSLSLLALLALRNTLEVARDATRAPAASGLFAPRIAASKVVQAALALVDRGDCTLAAPHAFWLYPQIGVRPISWLPATRSALPSAQPRCVVLLRERVGYNTDSARLHTQLDALSQTKQVVLLRRDALAELWWTARLPDALLAQADVRLP